VRDPASPPPGPVPRLILVVGDAFVDLSARVPRFPPEGTDVHVRRIRWSSGGSAATVAAALASLGTPARLLARVGGDQAAEVALRAAREAGVDLSLVQRDPGEPTGLCFVVVSPGGERTFLSARGANADLAMPADLPGLLAGTAGLHLSGYALVGGAHRVTALGIAAAAKESGLPVSLDLCLPLVEGRRAETLDLLPRLAVVFGNEREVALLAGGDADSSVEAAARELVVRGARIAVAKTGEKGCVVASPEGAVAVPGFPVEAVDTTGCGDAFVAGFLHALSRGAALPLCGALGNALGALAATAPGSGDALPGRERLRSFVASADAATVLLPFLPPAANDATR